MKILRLFLDDAIKMVSRAGTFWAMDFIEMVKYDIKMEVHFQVLLMK